MFDLSIQQLLYRLAAWLLIAGTHGWALAASARLLGDHGPVHDGRRTANPLPHLGLFGSLTGIFFGTGWLRPVSLEDGDRWRGPTRGLVIGLAGLVFTLVLAFVVRLVRPLLFTGLSTAASLPLITFADTFIRMSVGFVALNLVPLPPLALGQWWPSQDDAARRRRDRVGLVVGILIVVLFLVGAAQPLLRPLRSWLAGLIAFA